MLKTGTNKTEFQIENRIIANNKIELREENGSKIITGYALKWEELSQEIGFWFSFREKFQKGAFEEYLKNSSNDVKVLMNHDTNKIIGRRKNNTVMIEENETGLHYSVVLANTTLGNDLYESVKRQDIDGVSIGFKMLNQEWDESDEENIVRTVKKAELIEFSFTAWPAYTSTTTNVDNRSNNPYVKFTFQNKKNKLEEIKRYNKINSFKNKNQEV